MKAILLLIVLLLCLPLIPIGLIIFSYILRIYDFQEVLAHGISTKASIVRKYARNRIVFQYQDTFGHMHCKDIIVSRSEYRRFQVGNSINIEYSARRPHIVFFKETLDQSRAAGQKPNQSNLNSSE